MCTCMESVISQQLDSMRHHLSFHGCQKTTNDRHFLEVGSMLLNTWLERCSDAHFA